MRVTNEGLTIAAYAQAKAGALAGSELRSIFGDGAVKRAVARGDLVRVLPNVYAAALHARSFAVRAQAAAMWSKAPVSGQAALFLWGLIDKPPHTIEVLVDGRRKLRAPAWIRVRRSIATVPQTVRRSIATVSPAAAVVLAYGQVAADRRADVVYRAVRQELVGVRQLKAMIRTVPRVAARKGLERSIAAAARGARSFLEEHALYKVFNTAEFAEFERQHELVVEGHQFFLDMYDAETKLAVELDGRDGHTDAGRQRNIARDAWAASFGILTLRFSYADIINRPDWCRRMVREAMISRRRALG